MNNTNTYKVNFTVIGNRESATAVTFSPSIRKALEQAEGEAWREFETLGNTNYADCWVQIYNPKGRVIWAGFEGELRKAA